VSSSSQHGDIITIIHDVEMNGGVTHSLGTVGYSPVYEN